MERTFLYHAHVTGLSGEVTLPFHELIPVQAASAIPVTGGYCATRVGNFNYRDMISFRSATSITSGSFSESDDAWSTLMTTEVEELNVLDVLTAHRVVARLTSKHPRNGEEPSIIPLGSYFENLRIGGNEINVQVDDRSFVRCAKYSELREQINQNLDFRHQLSHREDLSARAPKGILLCTVLKMLGDYPGLEVNGNSVHMPQFGTVFLGEFLVTPYSRTITMVRLVLGSTPKGHVTIGSGSGNGEPYPP